MPSYTFQSYPDPQSLSQHWGRYLKTLDALGKSPRDRAILQSIWDGAMQSGFPEQAFDYSYLNEAPKDIEIPKSAKATEKVASSTPKTTQSTLRKAVNNVSNKVTIAKEYGKVLAENAIDKAKTGLSAVRSVPWTSAGAAPLGVALAGMGWALMNGSRMDNNGTTKQLANEMNQAFKAGLYVDDEGNYVDANTNEIVEPEIAAKRIDSANTPVVNNAPVGASGSGMEYPASEVPSISSIDGGYAEYENPNTPTFVKNSLEGLSDLALANAVIRGKYGNGDARKKALGDRYAEVQALVNQRMANSAPRQARDASKVNATDKYAKLPSAVNTPVTPTAYSDEELVVPKQFGMTPWQIM